MVCLLMILSSGATYIVFILAPKTEPWGPPHEKVCAEENVLFISALQDRLSRYD